MMVNILVTAIGLAFFAVVIVTPIWLTGRLFKWVIRRRILLLDALAERGAVHAFDTPLRLATVIFGAGAVFAGLGFVPGALWVLDGDLDARRTFFGLLVVGAVFALLARWMLRPGLKIFVVADDHLVQHRAGSAHRIDGGRERSIEFADLQRLHEGRSITGALWVHGASDRFRVSMQSERFDELVAALRTARPDLPYTSVRDAKRARRAAKHPPDRTRFSVSKVMLRSTVGFFAALLIFFLAWPWFAVEGDHPTRDSIIFMGIGVGIWLMFAGLVAHESFPRRQPIEIDLRDGVLAWRTMRRGWQERDVREVVTVTVETTIIYVKGHPGYRHPVRIRFVQRDGGGAHDDVLVIGDARARQMATSPQQLAAAIRSHVYDPSHRSDEDRARADELMRAAEDAQSVQRSIALDPSPDRLRELRRLGDLQRRAGDHELAESSYRAHLDHSPTDADAWQGLAAVYEATGRRDLAMEATETAERHLLRGT